MLPLNGHLSILGKIKHSTGKWSVLTLNEGQIGGELRLPIGRVGTHSYHIRRNEQKQPNVFILGPYGWQ